jgi:hypothetical protein
MEIPRARIRFGNAPCAETWRLVKTTPHDAPATTLAQTATTG